MKPHKEVAKEFSVPVSTLRDQNFGLVSLDVTIGFDSIFNRDEEQKLVQNINTGHLKFCKNVRVLCQDSEFKCPHCLHKNV